MNRITAFVGFMSSGKDTVGDYLVRNHGFTSYAFADPLKDCLAAIFQWDRQLLSGTTPESRQWRETIDPWWAEKLDIENFTPRFAMQNFGTDVMRKFFHNDVWILNMEKRLLASSGPVILTDGRFRNEIAMVRKLGGRIYRVKRGDDPIWMPLAKLANNGDIHAQSELKNAYRVHPSEWSWIGQHLDGTIDNNGTVADLITNASREIGLIES